MFQCCNDVQVGDDIGGGTSLLNKKFAEVHVKIEPLAQDTCRICLKEGKLAIFGANVNGALCQSIYKIAGVEVTYEDPYPKFLCETCYSLLQGAILFRRTALRSERKLKQLEIHSDDDNVKDETEEKSTDSEQLKKQICFGNSALKNKLVKEIKPDPNFDIDDFVVCPDSDSANNLTENKKSKTKRSKKRKWIKCLSCDENFYTFTEFSKHRKVCRKITLGCALCNEKFNKYQDFANHKRSEHEKKSHNKSKKTETTKTPRPRKEKSPHVCDICGKTFTTKGIFSRHRSVHFNEKPFKCSMCTYQCRLKAALKRHQVIHFNDLPFQCALCPYRSRLKESLTMHMRSHTGEKPYQCEQCPSRFVSRSNLSKHVMRHRDYRFCCDVCSKGFYTKGELDLHMKDDHTEGKRHVCRFCEKSFAHRNAMMKHERKVHKRKHLISGAMPIYLKVETMKQQHETLSYTVQQNVEVQTET